MGRRYDSAGGQRDRRPGVGTKASHDYAEVFDGVPSQHDGKDAAVVAELAALGKASPGARDRRFLGGRTGLLGGRDGGPAADAHTLAGTLRRGSWGDWPEASQVLKLSSGTLLRSLEALWDSPGVGRGRGRRDAVGPLGSVAVVGGEDRGVVGRGTVQCGCCAGSLATASDPGVRRAGAGRPAAGQSAQNGGCVSWLRGIRCSRRQGKVVGVPTAVCLVDQHG